MQTIKVPGKLMLAGEWGILEPGASCIVMAVDQYLTATITKLDAAPQNQCIIQLPDIGIPTITATYLDGNLTPQEVLTQEQIKQASLSLNAASLALRWLEEEKKSLRPFILTLTSDVSTITLPTGKTTKIGFGSSAATVVATIKALLSFHEFDLTAPQILDVVFKLAVLAHQATQGGSGSGFDIAAATYGTTIRYHRFDSAWLQAACSLTAHAHPSIQFFHSAQKPLRASGITNPAPNSNSNHHTDNLPLTPSETSHTHPSIQFFRSAQKPLRASGITYPTPNSNSNHTENNSPLTPSETSHTHPSIQFFRSAQKPLRASGITNPAPNSNSNHPENSSPLTPSETSHDHTPTTPPEKSYELTQSAATPPPAHPECFAQQNVSRDASTTSLTNLVNTPWPGLKITPLKIPSSIIMLVGFSGTSAHTPTLVNAMQTYKKNNPSTYTELATAITNTVDDLEQALRKKNTANILAVINRNNALLASLAQTSGLTLITPGLNTLIQRAQVHGAAAKFSGAGGGDCGIAVCTDTATASAITQAWQQAGIIPLTVKIL